MNLKYLIIPGILLFTSVSSSHDQLCPSDMVFNGKNACVDVYEWPNKAGIKPLLAVSGTAETSDKSFVAEDLCASVGKRVCTRQEWISACEGPEHLKYSYGNEYNPEACNTEKLWKPVNPIKVAKRDPKHLKWLDQSEASGNKNACISPVGAYDMIGNAEEWVKCDSGKFGWCLVGGYWATGKKATCRYSITKHAPNWHYYNSVRCCSDIRK